MKTFRLFNGALALSIAVATCSTSFAVEKIEQPINQTQASLAETLQEMRVDYAANAINPKMLARIDALVAQIDAVLQTKPENEVELRELRKTALKFRGQVSKALGGEGSDLVNATADSTLLPPTTDLPPGTIISETVMGTTPVSGTTFSSMGSYSSGGGGSGGSASFGGGGGGLIALGLGAAGLAVGISNNDNNNNPGPIASQSAN